MDFLGGGFRGVVLPFNKSLTCREYDNRFRGAGTHITKLVLALHTSLSCTDMHSFNMVMIPVFENEQAFSFGSTFIFFILYQEEPFLIGTLPK